MTRKRNLNLDQISNYQDQNLNSDSPNNPNYDSFKEQIIAGLKSGKGLTGKDGIFSGMVKDVLETMLSEECVLYSFRY